MTPSQTNGKLPPAAPPAQSPKEALGVTPGSGLLKPSLQAAAGFAALFAALTFGPYYLEQSRAKEPPPAAADKSPTPAAVAPAPSEPAPSKGPAAVPVAGKGPAKGDIVDKLGENGTKTASPKVNPLDKKDDDILKDIK